MMMEQLGKVKPTAFVESLVQKLLNLSQHDLIIEVGPSILSVISTRPAVVRSLAHERLHVYPFEDVPTCWRRAYEEACLWEIVSILKSKAAIHHGSNAETIPEPSTPARWVAKVVWLCDMALILTGAPGRRREIDQILELVDDKEESLSTGNEKVFSGSVTDEDNVDDYRLDLINTGARKRRRVSSPRDIPSSFPPSPSRPLPLVDPGKSVPYLEESSMLRFGEHVNNETTPIIIAGSLKHWPASKRWKDPRYWLDRTHGGLRIVPIEIGKNYTDDGWGQKIMSFEDFMKRYLLRQEYGKGSTNVDREEEDSGNQSTGYLAQHDLLTQIPALRNDILIPDYCYVDTPPSPSHMPISQKPSTLVYYGCQDLSENGNENNDQGQSRGPSPSPCPPEEPLLNIWLGPGGTVSPAHTDPHHNILAQVFGKKYIRLFPPGETRKLYPMSSDHEAQDARGKDPAAGEGRAEEAHKTTGMNMSNTSQVNVGAFIDYHEGQRSLSKAPSQKDLKAREEEMNQFPLHKSAQFVETMLNAGECLYIPRGWWHYIESIETSCSVSFWWD